MNSIFPASILSRLSHTFAALLFLFLANQPPGARAAVFTVTNTLDGGAGSLREAILNANTNPGLNRIEFAIPPFDATVKTITPTTSNSLPIITNPVIIDGYTQPGSSSNTLAAGDNAVLLIAVNLTNNQSLHIRGGNSTVRGLVLHSWVSASSALTLEVLGTNVVEGCFIGTDAAGARDLAFGNYCIYIGAGSSNRIGGPGPGSRNLICGAVVTGMFVATGSNVIQGNFIGTDRTGTQALGNSTGITISSTPANGNLIGGTAVGAGNLISGNGIGISVASSNNVIQGNFIGTDVSGTLDLGNSSSAISMSGSRNTIGGATVAARNIISGNGQRGIDLSFSSFNIIQGNYIGTDITGSFAISNDTGGLRISGGTNTIGGITTTPGVPPGNVISGNRVFGLDIDQPSSRGNVIQGNVIGANAAGNARMGNQNYGILVQVGGTLTTIGGPSGAGNLIVANGTEGILIGTPADQVQIQGNFIGTDAAAALNLGNGGPGVHFNGTAGPNGAAIAGNVIAFNSGAGVFLQSGTNNLVSANRIFSNTGLGIDLGVAGVTTNDVNDADSGANNLQNFPVLTLATNDGPATIITGTLNSVANTTFRIEFFSNASCDPSGFGEGDSFLGTTNVTTDGSGNASFTFSPASQLAACSAVTATATDPNGNTSEFSARATVRGGSESSDLAVTMTGNPGAVDLNSNITYTIIVTNNGPCSATGATITDVLPGGVAFVSASSNCMNIGGTVMCNIGLLATGVRVTNQITVQALSGAMIVNTATVSGDQPDSISANDTASVATTVNQPPACTTVVTNTLDSGRGSLRNAILCANSNAGIDTITFNIPGPGPHTIHVPGDLPVITDTVIIDGANGGVASDRVELTGDGTNSTGLNLANAGSNEVRNLVINGFTSREIQFFNASASKVTGCFLGLNAAGTAIVAGSGIAIEMCCGSGGILIGGTNLAARNVMSAGNFSSVVVVGGGSATIQGNFIGLNAAGSAVVGQPGSGVAIENGFAIVGGTNSGARNVIAGFRGVSIGGNPALGRSSAVVQGNFIGTDASGMTALNFFGGEGVNCDHSAGCLITNNVISGNGTGVRSASSGVSGASSFNNMIQGNFIGVASDGFTALGNRFEGVTLGCPTNLVERNVIAFNGGVGVLNGVGPGVAGTRILGNSIFANGGLGIDVSPSGPNANDLCDADLGSFGAQNFPTITGVSRAGGMATITGFLNSKPSTSYRLEFFDNALCESNGFGEGQFFLGFTNLTTGADCTNLFTVTLPDHGGQFVTATATPTDLAGNTSEFSARFPGGPCQPSCVLTCPSNIVVAADSGQCGGSVNFPPPATSGDCGAVICSPSSGSFFPLGTTTVTCSASGTNCSFTVTVIDTQAPTIACPANIAVNVPSGQVNAVVNYPTQPIVSDNCPNVASTCAPPSASTFPLGVTIVTCRAIDTSGQSNACTFSVTVTATNAPCTIVCSSNLLASTPPGECGATVNYSGPSTSGGCGQVSCTPPSGSFFAKGTNTVTCTATNMQSCSFTVIVRDTDPPNMTCPATIVRSTDAGQCSASNVTYQPTVLENCFDLTVSCAPPSGSTFQKGTNVVTCTASDAASNRVTCSFNVVVNDTEVPGIVFCPTNRSYSASFGSNGTVVSFPFMVMDDNCANGSSGCQPASGSFFPIGTTMVTCSVFDLAGNSNGCTFSVTVTNLPDTTPPVLIVVTPSENQFFTNANIMVTGTASDVSGLKSVTVNGTEVLSMSGSQLVHFFPAYTLAPGINTIVVVATDNSVDMNSTTQIVHAILISGGCETAAPPHLEIFSPTDGSIFINRYVTLFGSVESESPLVAVTVVNNRTEPSNASVDGTNWMAEDVRLKLGTNILEVTALDACAREFTAQVTVVRVYTNYVNTDLRTAHAQLTLASRRHRDAIDVTLRFNDYGINFNPAMDWIVVRFGEFVAKVPPNSLQNFMLRQAQTTAAGTLSSLFLDLDHRRLRYTASGIYFTNLNPFPLSVKIGTNKLGPELISFDIPTPDSTGQFVWTYGPQLPDTELLFLDKAVITASSFMLFGKINILSQPDPRANVVCLALARFQEALPGEGWSESEAGHFVYHRPDTLSGGVELMMLNYEQGTWMVHGQADLRYIRNGSSPSILLEVGEFAARFRVTLSSQNGTVFKY